MPRFGDSVSRLRKACVLVGLMFIAFFLNELSAVAEESKVRKASSIVAVLTMVSRSLHIHLLEQAIELDVS